MTAKRKIFLIYFLTGVFSLALIGLYIFLDKLQRNAQQGALGGPQVVDVGKEVKEDILTISNDIELTNQLGEKVRLSDLEDKVWVLAQFFAACPNCAARNGDHLVELYQRYSDNPDFHMVCMTVDPDSDDEEKLKAYQNALGGKPENWWFLTGPKEQLHRYMEDELKFMAVRERTNEEDIASQGRYAHDMGVAVFGKGLRMLEKRDLLAAKVEDETMTLYKQFEIDLDNAIKRALSGQGREGFE